jgi:tryptophanyl-tRNA synthetase
MQRILSGIRPTGGIHLGNYLGSLKQWVELSQAKDTECFFMIADLHALLSFRETPLDQASLDLLAWEMAAGLNPEQTNIALFLQSAISAHNELAWLLGAFVTTAELERMTQYKDLVAERRERPSAAFFTYPVLQAADILLYKANVVPVGEDQVQHIELTRTIARRLNTQAGSDLLPEPRPQLTSAGRILSLHDPSKKMAKSLPQGALLLEDDEATLRQKIMRAVTDAGEPKGEFPDDMMTQDTFSPEERALLFEHMSPGVRNLFVILESVSSDDNQLDAFLHSFRNNTLQYRDLKAAVADAVVAFVVPLKERYDAIRGDEASLLHILQAGNARANDVARRTLEEVQRDLHILAS